MVDTDKTSDFANKIITRITNAITTHNSDSTAHPSKINASDIVDNLTTNDATKVLSAKQGKALKDEIGDIHSIIYGTGES